MKLFCILFVLISVANQDNDSNCTSNEKDLCQVLFEMIEDDQKYRGTSEKITDYYPAVLDSLLVSNGFSNNDLSALPENQQGTIKQEALTLAAKKLKPRLAQNDSLFAIQQKLDEKNTKKLLDLTKKHGWLTSKSLRCNKQFKTSLIFRHAPKKYWKEVRLLIEKEKEAKRISEYEYDIIDNHLKGRPPLTKTYTDFTDN